MEIPRRHISKGQEFCFSSCDGSASSTRNMSGMVIVNRSELCRGPGPQLSDLRCFAQLVCDVPVHFLGAFCLSCH